MSENHNIVEYREEIDAALKVDPGRLGDIFRSGDDSPGEIASALGVSTKGFVSNYRRHIAAIREGEIPTSITTALETARAVRGFLKRNEELSDGSQNALREIAVKCEEVARDDSLVEKEEAANKERNRKLESTSSIGIYVYSYPHYLNYPYISSEDGVTDERTMMKVGMSGVGTKERIFGQTAAMPEEPEILYLFTRAGEVRFSSDDKLLRKVEKQIHNHLRTIGHRRSSDAGGGTEWFLTNKATIESTANLLDLRTDEEDNSGDDT